MLEEVFTQTNIYFAVNLVISIVAGVLIGVERELRGKDAGIRTQCLVIGGAMIFTYVSILIDPSSPARIAAQIVTGIGFLGAGIILKETNGRITNLTTAASIWFSASIGMALGFKGYFLAISALVFALIVPMLPQVNKDYSLTINNNTKRPNNRRN